MPKKRKDGRPNIVWFFGDQHRAQALGCADNPQVRTPNIDALAAQGVHFTQAVSGCPWCSPFRGSLLTGRYPQHCVVETPQVLDPSTLTVAQMFENASYETAYFGKWHLAWDKSMPVPEIDGRRRHDAIPVPREMRGGFRTWLGYNNGNTMFDIFLQGHRADGEEVPIHRTGGFEPDCLTDLASAFILERAASPGAEEKPFFAVLSAEPPHNPYVAPDRWMVRHRPEDIQLRPNVPHIDRIEQQARESLAGYYAMIENLDWNVGRLVAALKRSGAWDHTYVVFFSDHGDQHWSQGYKGKSQPWEESIRIPFIIAGGAVAEEARGTRTAAVLNTVDILPTTLGLCGAAPKGDPPGFDYSGYATPAARPSAPEPDSALLQHLVHKRSSHTMNCTWRGVVTRDRWKYVCSEGVPLAMFDLNEDPFEQHNVVFKEAYREERVALERRLREWLDATRDRYDVPEAPTS